ncbi:hypothetical protein AGMMS49938_00670 [Fibrobacterales bacterium]|nr:hypothetical protein AGMMS49938_00670 [Fibrobacterales bacterium]
MEKELFIKIPHIDVEMLSRDHYDRLDKEAVKELAAKTYTLIIAKYSAKNKIAGLSGDQKSKELPKNNLENISLSKDAHTPNATNNNATIFQALPYR